MRIEVLLNLGLRDYPDNALPSGVHDVDEKFARQLIARKLAVEVVEPPSVKMVAPSGEIVSESQPAVVKPADTHKPVRAKQSPKEQ